MTDRPEVAACTFCALDQEQVAMLIAGPAVYICNNCVELCADIFRKKKSGALDHLKTDTGEESPPEAPDYPCSFCGETKDEKIAGVTVFICDDCVAACVKVIGDNPLHAGKPHSPDGD